MRNTSYHVHTSRFPMSLNTLLRSRTVARTLAVCLRASHIKHVSGGNNLSISVFNNIKHIELLISANGLQCYSDLTRYRARLAPCPLPDIERFMYVCMCVELRLIMLANPYLLCLSVHGPSRLSPPPRTGCSPLTAAVFVEVSWSSLLS